MKEIDSMKHLGQIAIIAGVSLVGELLSYLIPLPVPGSIYGLLLMLLLLVTKTIRLRQVKAVANWLLSLMPIMFVGPTVSLMNSYESYKSFLIPVIVICVVTTILTMAITGCTAQILMFRHNRKEHKHHD
jgi:holin-like protein